MRKPRLFWKLFAALTATSLLVLIALIFLISRVHEQFVVRGQQTHLEAMARLAAREVEPTLAPGREADLRATVRRLDALCGARVTVILPAGEVAADSRRDTAVMDTHAGRPEIMEALAGQVGHARRFSRSTGMRMLYVAQPLPGAEGVRGVLRLALPDQALQDVAGPLRRNLLLVAAALVVLAALVSAWLSWQMSRPLAAMRRVAHDLAEGRSESVDWPSPDTLEMVELAEALRRMSSRLRDQVADTEELLAEQRTVFASMVDGVLLVDRAGRIVDFNRAAASWFGHDVDQVRGRDILEVVRHPRLDELVRRTLAGPGPVEGDLVLHGAREVQVQVHGAPIRAGLGRAAAVLVLTDVTRLRDVERAHRDFVANASHELKTPVTTIKGFAETLAGDELDPVQVKRFAGIVARQSDQLSALIEDLLELTRLEHQRDTAPLERENMAVSAILWGAVATCAAEAREKAIEITVKCAENLAAAVNVPLLRRALTNLIENAIKYSPAHTAVLVEGSAREGNLCLEVRDQGPGIAPEHQARIFVRFYRVDKSLRRNLGGTGLGLSIVRHAAEAHGGTVSVQSSIGFGSTFTISLPLVLGS